MWKRLATRTALAAFAAATVVGVPCAVLAAGASAQNSTGSTIILTNASNGTTVKAHVGDLVEVDLSGGALQWSEASVASVSAANPVLVEISGSMSPDGSSQTIFLVTGRGTAGLVAIGNPRCTGDICPLIPSLLWHATVVVPGVTPVSAVSQ